MCHRTVRTRLDSPPGRSIRPGARSRCQRVLAIALALHLAAAAAPSLAPALPPPHDPGPFEGGELIASGLGALGGDALIVGAGYATLQMFANGALQPNAHSFRNAAFLLAGAAVIVPPLTAALLGKLARSPPASGSFWKAFALATAGHAIALGAAYVAYPRFWVFLPVELVAVAAGTSVGLHWGHRAHVEASAPRREEPAGAPRPLAALEFPVCPDG